MLVILAIAALAILACVVLVSLGKGGELTEFPPDVPPLDLPEPGQLTAVDFMALQLPVNLVGYHTQSVDETLRRAASAISARDTRIAVLEQRVSELLSSRLYARQEVYAAPSPNGGPRTDHEPEAPAVPLELREEGDPLPTAAAPGAAAGPLPEPAAEVTTTEPAATAAEEPSGAAAEKSAADSTGSSAAEPEETVAAEPEETVAAEPEEAAADEAEPARAVTAKNGKDSA